MLPIYCRYNRQTASTTITLKHEITDYEYKKLESPIPRVFANNHSCRSEVSDTFF